MRDRVCGRSDSQPLTLASFVANAQKAGKVVGVGFVSALSCLGDDGQILLTPSPAIFFFSYTGCRDRGYVEGRNLNHRAKREEGKVEALIGGRRGVWYSSRGHPSPYADPKSPIACKAATSMIPIVCVCRQRG